MAFKLMQTFSWGAIPPRGRSLTIAFLVAGSFSVAPALAQETRPLTENPTLIRGCRQLNQSAQIFDNSTLGPAANRIGTLNAGTQVTLTGAVSPGRAQIFLGSGTLSSVQPVGWLNAANLGPCGSTPPPTGACFRAQVALVVRSGPTSSSAVLAGYSAGDTVIASANPPTQQISADGRRWLQVRMSTGGTGWVASTGANGVGSNLTSIPCP